MYDTQSDQIACYLSQAKTTDFTSIPRNSKEILTIVDKIQFKFDSFTIRKRKKDTRTKTGIEKQGWNNPFMKG